MLTGALRAALRTDALSAERVWIIALPVVFVLALGNLARLLLLTFLCAVPLDTFIGPLIARGGPVTIRTAVILVSIAATAYAALWFVAGIRELVRHWSRAVPRPVFVRTLALGMFLVLGCISIRSAFVVPTPRRYLAKARAEIKAGLWWRFRVSVSWNVAGSWELCTELRAGEDERLSFYGACGLYYLGDRSAETRHAIHDWIEGYRDRLEPRNRLPAEEWFALEWALFLVRHSGAAHWGGHLTGDWEYHREWWDGVKECFRAP
jgi:hypothetical protein